jgi:hypothetical protein
MFQRVFFSASDLFGDSASFVAMAKKVSAGSRRGGIRPSIPETA